MDTSTHMQSAAISFSRALQMLGDGEKPYPKSSMNALDAAGEGPKWFNIGRRKFVLITDLNAWLESQAEKSRKYGRGRRST